MDDLRRVALNYEQARRSVYQRYIAASDAFEPEVVLDAVDTYVMLGRGGRSGGKLVIKPEEQQGVLNALVFVLTNLPASDDPEHPGQIDWRQDSQLQELFRVVGKGVEDRPLKMTLDALRTAIGQSQRDRTRENMALILADFGEKDDTAIAILRKMSEEKKRPWRSTQSALRLAKLGDENGWKHIMRQMEGEGEYQAATSLAQQGRRGLEELTAKYGQTGDVDRLTTSIKNVISGRINCASASAGCQPFNNCFEQRYARWLIECLDGHCEAATTNRAVGGECSLGR